MYVKLYPIIETHPIPMFDWYYNNDIHHRKSSSNRLLIVYIDHMHSLYTRLDMVFSVIGFICLA